MDLHLRHLFDERRARADTTLTDLKRWSAVAFNGDGDPTGDEWPVYRCICFELTDGQHVYLLSDGRWYRIAKDYVAIVEEKFRSLVAADEELPPYDADSEGAYNQGLAGRDFRLIDRKLVRVGGDAPPRLRTFIVIALATALRRGAIMRICWKHLDFEGGFFNLPPGRGTKGIPPRLPMTAAVKAELLAHRARCGRVQGNGLVFAGSIDAIRDDLRRVRKDCAKIAPERREKIGFHALRHTAASWMVQDGVPLYEVARILGHGSTYVTERYAHLVPGFAQVPIDKLGARLRPEDLPPVNGAGANGTPAPAAEVLPGNRAKRSVNGAEPKANARRKPIRGASRRRPRSNEPGGGARPT